MLFRFDVMAKVLEDVAEVRAALSRYLDQTDAEGRVLGDAQRGVYVFYDYDGEPLYVGQTVERVRTRIRRHLTNQRTDAITMGVLDPSDVAYVEVWPFYRDMTKDEAARVMSSAEYTVYRHVTENSAARAVLNEKDIPETPLIELPKSIKGRVVPLEMYLSRRHPDLCIERKARAVLALVEVIKGRAVSAGLRRTLHTQVRILERLCGARVDNAASEADSQSLTDPPDDFFALFGMTQ